MFGLGIGEVLIILVFALIFIGPKKLPDLAKGLGKGIREFNKARQGILDEINSPSSPDSKLPSSQRTNAAVTPDEPSREEPPSPKLS